MIELATKKNSNECAPTLHDFTPIVEENKTVGMTCLICGKTIREFVDASDLYVDADGNLIGMPKFFDGGFSRPYHRKDGKF